jgi:solute carrier family 25 phosphate transporter 23/24/25/41
MEFTSLESHRDGKPTLLKGFNPFYLNSVQKTRSWLEICVPIMEMQANRVKSFLELKVPKEFAKTGSVFASQSIPLNPLELFGSNSNIKNKLENSQEKLKLFFSTNFSHLRESSAFRCLVSGGVAGAISRTATAPLDRLKLVLQVQSSQNSIAMSQCIRKMLQEGGFASFYKGNGTNIVKIAPETSVKFFAYEKIKNMLADDHKTITPGKRFLAGATAGVIAQITIYPLECVKTRLALAQPGIYKGIFNCLNTTLKREGIKSLYRGLGPSLMGVIPYAGIDLAVYETLKSLYISHTESTSNQTSILPLFMCGLASSTCGQVVSYPLSLIRTRLQAQGMEGHPILYSSSVDAFKKIVSREGVFGLYKGILPNFLKVAPAVSISYVVYEKTKSFMTPQ